MRLVQLQRIRVSNVDTMMRTMPFYFRASDAVGLDFTCQLEFTGPGGGDWVLRVAEQRCNVRPGRAEAPDLTVRCDGRVFLGVHRGEVNPVMALLLGRIRLRGQRGLFLVFPRIFPVRAPEGWVRRLVWRLMRARRRGMHAT